MTDWTTIRVRQAAKDDAEARKPDDMTWSEWLRREEYDPDLGIDYAEIATQTADELEARLP